MLFNLQRSLVLAVGLLAISCDHGEATTAPESRVQMQVQVQQSDDFALPVTVESSDVIQMAMNDDEIPVFRKTDEGFVLLSNCR